MNEDHERRLAEGARHINSLYEFIERIIMSATTNDLVVLAQAQKVLIGQLQTFVASQAAEIATLSASQGLTAQEQSDVDATAGQLTDSNAAITAIVPPVVPPVVVVAGSAPAAS